MTIEQASFQDEGSYSCKLPIKDGNFNKLFMVTVEGAY